MSTRLCVTLLLGWTVFGAIAHAQTPSPTFLARQDYVTDPLVGATGDSNGDGIQGIVYLGPTPVVLLGNGDGTFRPALLSDYSLIGGNGFAVADLNGDGILGLVSGNVTGYLQVGYGNGDGTFEGGPMFNLREVPISIAVADVNGDGLPDILVSTKGLLIFLNQDGGVFGPYTTLFPGKDVQATAVVDLNGDGIADMAVGTGQGATVMLGTGGGAFITAGQEPATLTAAIGQAGVLPVARVSHPRKRLQRSLQPDAGPGRDPTHGIRSS